MTDISNYVEQFKTHPHTHQITGTSLLVEHPYFGLLDQMGVGKTKQTIDAACILCERGQIDVVLVVTPSPVRSVWIDPSPELGEIKKHSWIPSRVTEWHSKSKVIWKDENPRLDFLVTNYEFLRNKERRDELIRLLKDRNVMMVCDESSFIKNRVAEQTKSCIKIGSTVARRVILNGTPMGNNGPLDMWSQMLFLSPTILPYVNFYAFRAAFAIMGGYQRHQVIKWKDLKKFQALIAPHVIRREKKDCLDLPAKIYTQLEVPLSEATWKLYKQMRDDAVVWMDENPTMAAQAGVKVMRLAQITSGFLGGFPLEDNETGVTEIGREKLDALRHQVTEALKEDKNRKIIVWCRFRLELERVERELKDLLPTFRLYAQKQSERDESVERFSQQGETGAALLAAHVMSGGFGLNFISTDCVFYMSNDRSLLGRMQSEDRNHRRGQTKHVVYTDMIATGPKGQQTCDHQIVKALRAHEELANWTVSAWRKALTQED